MPLFVRKIVYAVLTIIIALFSIFKLINYSIVKRSPIFNLPAEINSIVLGNSHPEHAFNDSLIDHLLNLSQSGDSYFYTYIKLKKLLEKNANIKTVFIDISEDQFLKDKVNNRVWGKKYLNWKYPIYSPYMDFHENELIFKHNPIDYIAVFLLSIRINGDKVMYKNYFYSKIIGGYRYSDNFKIDSLLEIQKKKSDRSFHPNYQDDDLNKENINYLEKCITLCNANHIKIFFTRSPLYKYIYDDDQIFKRVLNKQFKEIELLDFKQFPLKNNEYRDFEHLNYWGAIRFSNFFNDIIKKGILESDNKQHIIDSVMQRF